MLYEYYVDELMIVMDEYTELHKPENEREDRIREVFADEIELEG